MSGREKIERYTTHWKSLQWLAVTCKALACGFVVAGLVWFFFQEAVLAFSVFSLVAGLAFYLFYQHSRLPKLSTTYVAHFLNQQYQVFEYSIQLLLQEPESLSVPARMQGRKVGKKLLEKELRRPPAGVLDAFLWLLLALLCTSLLGYFAGSIPLNGQGQPVQQASIPNTADTLFTETLAGEIPALSEGRLLVSPPAYTRQKSYYTELASLRAPEGSRLTWQLSFTAKVVQPWLQLSSGDSIAFQATSKGDFTAQLVLDKGMLYQLGWRAKTGKEQVTEYFRLDAVPDEAPYIQIRKPVQYMRVEEAGPIDFRAEVRDDYGLQEAYLQLTISQGSGENVNFREEKLWFDEDFSSQALQKELERQIDPKALGMLPGDELYYYLVVLDNRQPRPQRSRSETWFYHWLDTASTSAFEMSGMAMDIMPDYFRSQRQIIIDTEKLLQERQGLSAEEFEKRSNNLGVDQKLLRLRYGKFLGEEFESDYGLIEHHEEDEDDHEEEHEEESEEGALPGQVEHEHEVPLHEEPVSPSAGHLLREFMHAHDTEEGATFYEESIKVKLKAALAEMWESELRLRTVRPKEALPYQYRALEIIKGVQQATRIYVERIGFDPPPLKPAEKRLTGELDQVASRSETRSSKPQDSLSAVREMIPLLEGKDMPSKSLVQRTGQELAAIVQNEPRPGFLQALNHLASLEKGESLHPQQKRELLMHLYALLPAGEPVLQKGGPYRSEIEKAFMRKLGGSDE